MSNLTGEFDVVVEIGERAISRVLASMHQNEHGSYTFLNSFRTFIDDTYHAGDVIPAAERTGVRGIAEVQASTPYFSIPAPDPHTPNVSRFTATFHIMARFSPDAGTPLMPMVLKGDLLATMRIGSASPPTLGHVITIGLRNDDIQVNFTPSSSTPVPADQLNRLNQLLHNFMRTGFESMDLPLTLPANIANLQFKTLSGSPAVIPLMLKFVHPDGTPPTPVSSTAADAIHEIFLQPENEFAIGVGQDYIVPLLTNAVRSQVAGFLPSGVTISNLNIALQEGQIMLNISGYGGGCGGEVNFEVHQPLHLVVRDSDHAVVVQSPLPAAAVHASGRSWFGFLATGTVESSIREALSRYQATLISQANTQIQAQLGMFNANDILAGLGVRGASVYFTAVAVHSNGIVLQSALNLPNWTPPVVAQIHPPQIVTLDGVRQWEFNAHPSWIPGGSISGYTWGGEITNHVTFVEHVEVSRWSGPEQVCLTVHGSVVAPNGSSGGGSINARNTTHCSAISPSWPYSFPIELDATRRFIILNGCWPEGPGDLAGYFDLAALPRNPAQTAANLIVHFTDPQKNDSPGLILETLSQSDVRPSAAFIIAVLDPNQIAGMQPLKVNIPNTALAWADDSQGFWKKVFNATQLPATFLINAEGKIAWEMQGALDVEKLTAGFKEHLARGGTLEWQTVNTAVKVGDLAQDFLFKYDQEDEMALRKLHGHPVLLNFWKSWASPCIEELQALEHQAKEYAQEGGIILAINDGEEQQHAADIFKQYGFTLQFVADPDRKIAKQYGINCWPTSVSINKYGYIDGIQMGISPEVKAARKKAG